MDDVALEEDKKPFDAELGVNDDDSQPDPDESLLLESGNGRVWVVKIPKFLMERWSAIDEEGKHLATIRVYNNSKPIPGRPVHKGPRIVLLLPPSTDPPTPNEKGDDPNTAEADEFELEMINDAVDNVVVVAEREKDPNQPLSRARSTVLTGRVKHDCNLKPMFTESYRRRMKARTKAANTPARTIQMIDDVVMGGRGSINMLSSGVSNTGKFSDLVKARPKFAKGSFERMARIPRNQLLDILFNLYRERPRWSVKDLRQKSQQPEVYLKEVLSEIAFLHRSGEFNGTWELKANFQDDGVKAEHMAGSSVMLSFSGDIPPAGDVDIGDDDDDMDDDEDDDMEEVS